MSEKKTIKTIQPTRTPIPEQPAEVRRTNFEEVALGYRDAHAADESRRCLQCPKPLCVPGCPVGIDIPAFIKAVEEGDFKKAYVILTDANLLPAICGRVCPQETQCEAGCIVGKKLEPVAIGRLERFVGDMALKNRWVEIPRITPNGKKVAIVGSGPAGLTCAADLAKAGCEVVIYEALHVPGGVLMYGIPEFRLPKEIVQQEIDTLRKMGVKIEVDRIIGKIFTIPELIHERGFDAVFVGTGAGFPKFMGIPGESLNGVLSSNEFLTRANLMKAYEFPKYDTPVDMGENVAVIGCGNTAMDAARIALRLGAKNVYIVYRRSEKESPARIEELHHAMEEGVQFHWLTAPVALHGENGWVARMENIKMELGEPDDSGRRRPVPKEGSNYFLDVDTVIYALGTKANPIIAQTTPGLNLNKWGYIEVDSDTQMTSYPGVFAGGDIVTGSATVILAMGAGRRAAAGILSYLKLN
ncbi:MAG TPA: NADPH-dependent glutamate synthase [Thermoanaerobaculia bacterium]|nr:NADPH-dependent glutamate synthase [Thermoanaerobaculia bacterium]HUM29852.1 NADPH-dependent glutamate synthase [Thermoanaerobaculia bacterium]HXK68127.1 NADPH-dependent glutamate synthase [Thermoanaerobaculia bacterium]